MFSFEADEPDLGPFQPIEGFGCHAQMTREAVEFVDIEGSELASLSIGKHLAGRRPNSHLRRDDSALATR